jgi:8-oxo-dGTP pyrophosphatase MutT (NUDIX family)
MLNVFVLGYTKSGKTTVARGVAERLLLRAVSASGWIRGRVSPDVGTSVAGLTAASLDVLRGDPDACVRWLRAEHDVDGGGLVIDGIRNPRDFALLFRPERDIVIWLDASWSNAATAFEAAGLHGIEEFLRFQVELSLLQEARVPRFSVGRAAGEAPRGALVVQGLADVIAATALLVADAASRAEAPETRAGVCTVPIAPIDAWIAERVLYNEDPSRSSWLPCRILAVSSYPGSPLTFQVLVEGGALFSYVPPHRLLTKLPAECAALVEITDLVYRNAPVAPIAVTVLPTLAAAPCWVYLRHLQRWLQARYVATVDWYTENSLDHVLLLENGQIACLPSHKILFGKEGPLPPYRALKATWSATDAVDALLTAALVVIERADGKVLAVSRKEDRTDFGLPGGKLEPCELPEEAAARELWEETGVRVDPMALRRVFVGRARTPGRIAVAFMAESFVGTPMSREGAAVEWVSWDVLLRGSFREYNAALKAALAQETESAP